MKKFLLLWAALAITSSAAWAQKADDMVGEWYNFEKDAIVDVYKKGDAYYGKVSWLKNDFNEDKSKPKRDQKNPNEKLRTRVILGLGILKDLKWDADDKEWKGGEIYDTKSGKTYSCYAYLQKDGTLFFKGYILGMPFLGRSTTWTRASK